MLEAEYYSGFLYLATSGGRYENWTFIYVDMKLTKKKNQ
jgi:hypothetical protein